MNYESFSRLRAQFAKDGSKLTLPTITDPCKGGADASVAASFGDCPDKVALRWCSS